MLVKHVFLVEAPQKEAACQKVSRFLERYELVAYEKIELVRVYRADAPDFWSYLEKALRENKEFLEKSIHELQQEGFKTLEELLTLPQGYLSKLLHIIAHFLDGFLGIDSRFYNLVEDSHWLSRTLSRKIKDAPLKYWLVEIKAFSLQQEQSFEILKDPLAPKSL